VAALVPAAALASAGDSGQLRGFLEALIGAAQHKAAAPSATRPRRYDR
jgi:hypothetical protein